MDIDKYFYFINNLNSNVSQQTHFDIRILKRMIIRKATRWLIRNKKGIHSTYEIINSYKDTFTSLFKLSNSVIVGYDKKIIDDGKNSFIEKGISAKNAANIMAFDVCNPIFNIIKALEGTKYDLEEFASLYFVVSDKMGLSWFRRKVNNLNVSSRWDILAKVASMSDIDRYQRLLTDRIYSNYTGKDLTANQKVDMWFNENNCNIERWTSNLAEIHSVKEFNFSIISVIINQLFDLTYT